MRRANLASQDFLETKASVDHLVVLEFKVALALPGRREELVHLGHLVVVDSLASVAVQVNRAHVDQRDLQDRWGSQERSVNEAHKAVLDHRDLLASQDFVAKVEAVALLVTQDFRVLKEGLEV